jgi:hypothetical protein
MRVIGSRTPICTCITGTARIKTAASISMMARKLPRYAKFTVMRNPGATTTACALCCNTRGHGAASQPNTPPRSRHGEQLSKFDTQILGFGCGGLRLASVSRAALGLQHAAEIIGQMGFILNPVTGISQGVETLMSGPVWPRSSEWSSGRRSRYGTLRVGGLYGGQIQGGARVRGNRSRLTLVTGLLPCCGLHHFEIAPSRMLDFASSTSLCVAWWLVRRSKRLPHRRNYGSD